MTDEQALKAEREGLKDKAAKALMKPEKDLADADIQAVVAYLRTFKK
jgi:cytochrome c551/c552